jgi:DNA polymerase III epsilon subunit-like protein
MLINPYSKNIIFFDTEFSSLDSQRGEILSLALIKYSGEELYLELDYNGEVDEWPRKNILPSLKQEKVSKEKAIKLITEFIGNEKPYIMANVNQFDMIYFYKLLGLDGFNDKFNWVPIDFASILFGAGINPEALANWDQDFFDKLKVDSSTLHQHNALDDTRALREVYLKLV